MRITQANMLSPELAKQSAHVGQLLARLRIARNVTQSEAAVRAGLSRNTAYRLEKGDPGIALGQVLRYLDAVAPGASLLQLLSESDPALLTLRARERKQRARSLSTRELQDLDF